ncbi:MAG: glycosyltransferase [Coriobacteriia bacterium]|nr:glycosyltransferase [Coriobacteriia bacterium]
MRDKTAIIFLCEEAASLFKGGEDLPRYGGAGLNMYLIARQLLEVDQFDVYFVFNVNSARPYIDVDVLDGEGIQLLSRKKAHSSLPWRLFRKLSHVLGRPRGIPWRPVEDRETYDSLPKNRIVFSTMEYHAGELVFEAELASAKSVFRAASEKDVESLGIDSRSDNHALGYIRKVDAVVVQTQMQQKKLREAGIESTVIQKGFPHDPADAEISKDIDFLWVASCQAAYQPWKFIDLAKSLPGYTFLMLAPPGHIDLLNYLRRAATEIPNLKLIDRQISVEEAQMLFNRSKVFAFTKEYGSEPTSTIMQAFAGKAAVLSLQLELDGGLFEKRDAGINARGDFSQFVSSAKVLISDKVLREGYADRAHKILIEDYSPEGAREKYVKVFNSLEEC